VADDPLLATYHAAALAPLGPQDRYRLLAAVEPSERRRLLATMLDDAEAILRFRVGR
jgi:hypothetical protein